MIEWKKYSPSSPPLAGVEYLVSDGTTVDVAYLWDYSGEFEWAPPDMSELSHSSVVYYANINTPEPVEDAELL